MQIEDYLKAGKIAGEVRENTRKKNWVGSTLEEICEYVLRDMVAEEGGFYSAEDADSEGEEGKFYVWNIKELEEILGKESELLKPFRFNRYEKGELHPTSNSPFPWS